MTPLIGNSYIGPSLSASHKLGSELKEGVVDLRRAKRSAGLSTVRPASGLDRSVLDEESFHRTISLERKRTERSRKPFLLMLLDVGNCLPSDKDGKLLGKIL